MTKTAIFIGILFGWSLMLSCLLYTLHAKYDDIINKYRTTMDQLSHISDDLIGHNIEISTLRQNLNALKQETRDLDRTRTHLVRLGDAELRILVDLIGKERKAKK